MEQMLEHPIDDIKEVTEPTESMRQNSKMSYRFFKMNIVLTLFSMLIIVIVASTSTYAWFTFNGATNILPISSTISDGDSSLLISNTYDGEYKISTNLILANQLDVFEPLSTMDLNVFYRATGQDSNGISYLYAKDEQAMSHLMHGTVYLKAIYGNSNVYFHKQAMHISDDAQVLSCMRLALKMTSREGEHTYIFKLDELGDTSLAASRQTVPTPGTVVTAVNDKGSATFVADPSLEMAPYIAGVSKSGESNTVSDGRERLMYLERDEIGMVEYWLYVEGCDSNCINDVQAKDIYLQLAFAGTTVREYE